MISLTKIPLKTLIVLFFCIIIYFLLRLPHLTLQPIFADEAIYIRWAQVMRAEPTLRFLPLSDGKTPLFMWLMIPLFKVIQDPLLAGRVLSVVSGFVTLLGVLFLSWRFFNFKIAIVAIFLVALVPFNVFFDRMALVDSMLAAFSIWALNLSLLLVQKLRLDVAMVLGYSLGFGLLTKTPGFFNILALPASLFLFGFKDPNRQEKVVKLFGLWMVTLVITIAMYSILILGPGFSSLTSRNQDYIFAPNELFGRLLDPFIPHLHDITDWFLKLLTWPVTILVILGGALSVVLKNRVALAILFWVLIPLLIQMAFLKTFTARYIYFSIPPLLILGSWGLIYILDHIRSKYKTPATILVLLVVAGFCLNFDYDLLTNPAKAPLPNEERRGYLEDWTAGYGFSEIAQYLIDQSQQGGIVVGTEGSFGTLPDGLMIYLDRYSHTASQNHQISVVTGKATISAELRTSALEHPTFYIANRSRFSSLPSGVMLLKEYPKAVGTEIPQYAILLFKVLPEEQSTDKR